TERLFLWTNRCRGSWTRAFRDRRAGPRIPTSPTPGAGGDTAGAPRSRPALRSDRPDPRGPQARGPQMVQAAPRAGGEEIDGAARPSARR
ncbi:MAG: hypothetical protein MZW92_20410, partial [Comamonadaceae bacterium]|nr:hypothetical protein [Comamonadaceae bacterium]